MKDYLLDYLECPICHGNLSWKIIKSYGNEIDEAQATCESCANTYPVHKGIALFVDQKLTENDPWETIDRQLKMMFEQYPQIEHQLLHAQVNEMSPNDLFIDLFIKALLLERQTN